MADGTKPQFIVLGLDGGSWSFLEPWLDSGSLPNLSEIRETHHTGSLESCLPPVTSPNWKCYSTGRDPGQLGVYWWETLDWDNRTIGTPASGDYAGAELWDYLGQEDLESLVVNMPTTYPPTELRGRLVAGGPTAHPNDYTFPEDLETTLEDEFDYSPLPEAIDFIRSDPNRAVNEIRTLMKRRFEVAEFLLDRSPSDFVQVTLYLINVLQHHFGHRQPVREAWEWIDRKIGEWRETYPDVPMVLVSDHGCNEIDVQFNVNEWLIREGFLGANPTQDQTLLGWLGLNKDRISRLLARFGLKKSVKRALPRTIRNLLPAENNSVIGPGKNRIIDWDATRAYAFGQGPVFVNPDVPGSDFNATRDELLEEFRNLTTPGGTPLAQSVLKGSEYYGETARGTRPDLVIEQSPGLHISNSIGFDEVFQTPDRWEAENARDGMFAWVDPSEKTEFERPGDTVKITDIMPSILANMTGKIPEGLRGSPRFLREDSESLESIKPLLGERDRTGDEEATRETLEGLGYL